MAMDAYNDHNPLTDVETVHSLTDDISTGAWAKSSHTQGVMID